MIDGLDQVKNTVAAVIAKKHQGPGLLITRRSLIELSRGALASTVRGIDS